MRRHMDLGHSPARHTPSLWRGRVNEWPNQIWVCAPQTRHHKLRGCLGPGVKLLLRERHVAARPLPYVAVHTMRYPAADHHPKWSQAPPDVRWLAFSYLQRGMSHNLLGCTFRLSLRAGWDRRS